MTQHDYVLTAATVFGVLATFWGTGSAVNSLLKLIFAVLTIAGIFLLAGVK